MELDLGTVCHRLDLLLAELEGMKQNYSEGISAVKVTQDCFWTIWTSTLEGHSKVNGPGDTYGPHILNGPSSPKKKLMPCPLLEMD